METEFLEGLGMTANEIKVYCCVAEVGQISATDISKQTRLHRPNVYDSLNRLTNKGFVNQVIFHDAKFYEITNPDILIDVLKQKESKIKEMIPQMMIGQRINGSKSIIHIYEGMFAQRQIIRKFLDIRQPIYAFGIPKTMKTWIGEGFLKEFHKERIALKIEMLHIYDTDAIERVEYLNTIPYTKAGYLPNLAESKTMTTVCGPLIILTMFSVKPELIIEIENQGMADAYRQYFKVMYRQCKLH